MTPLVLIVEDRPEIANLWATHLEPLKVNVLQASNLTEAYAILGRVPPPDLVLLDLNLNHEERADFTVRQINHIKQFNPDMVLIVISGLLTPDIAKVAIEQGANGLANKIDMQRQVDLWREIQHSLANAPAKAKSLFGHAQDLLETISQRLHLF